MTANQLRRLELEETKRSNLQKEAETKRSNLVNEELEKKKFNRDVEQMRFERKRGMLNDVFKNSKAAAETIGQVIKNVIGGISMG